MKPQYNTFRWIGLPFLVAAFISLNFLSRSVSAQEAFPLTAMVTPTGTPGAETEEPSITTTPTEMIEENAYFPTITPTALITEETPLQPQEAERQVVPFQAMRGESSPLESIWPAFNISDTDIAPIDPSIAVDSAG